MNIVSLAPRHPCRIAIERASKGTATPVLWEMNQEKFIGHLKMHGEVFGIIASVNASEAAGVVKKIRDSRIQNLLYVMFLGRHDHRHIARALNAGADQAHVWPVDPALIAANIIAIKNRTRHEDAPVYEFGQLAFDPVACRLSSTAGEVSLTKSEAAVLEVLCRSPGRLVMRGVVYDAIYEGSYGTPDIKIVDVYLCKLRKKIAALSQMNFIVSVWGQGYRFEPDGFTPIIGTHREASSFRYAVAP